MNHVHETCTSCGVPGRGFTRIAGRLLCSPCVKDGENKAREARKAGLLEPRMAKGERPDRRKLRDMDKPEVFGYELDPITLTPIRQPIDVSKPGDYGADPVGDNMFRMVPSGDIVNAEERQKRLERRAGVLASDPIEDTTQVVEEDHGTHFEQVYPHKDATPAVPEYEIPADVLSEAKKIVKEQLGGETLDEEDAAVWDRIREEAAKILHYKTHGSHKMSEAPKMKTGQRKTKRVFKPSHSENTTIARWEWTPSRGLRVFYQNGPSYKSGWSLPELLRADHTYGDGLPAVEVQIESERTGQTDVSDLSPGDRVWAYIGRFPPGYAGEKGVVLSPEEAYEGKYELSPGEVWVKFDTSPMYPQRYKAQWLDKIPKVKTAQRTIFLNTEEDMKWLRDVHLPALSTSAKSAVIYGNEDYPDRIEVYESEDPIGDDVPLVFVPDEEGEYHQVSKETTGQRRAPVVGDRVQYSREWLRNTGFLTGPIPFAQGEVVAISELGKGRYLAHVKWDDPEMNDTDEGTKAVLVDNLSVVGRPELATLDEDGKYHQASKVKTGQFDEELENKTITLKFGPSMYEALTTVHGDQFDPTYALMSRGGPGVSVEATMSEVQAALGNIMEISNSLYEKGEELPEDLYELESFLRDAMSMMEGGRDSEGQLNILGAEKIPDRWLQGRTQALRTQHPDASEKELLQMAIANWIEQEKLEEQFWKERGESREAQMYPTSQHPFSDEYLSIETGDADLYVTPDGEILPSITSVPSGSWLFLGVSTHHWHNRIIHSFKGVWDNPSLAVGAYGWDKDHGTTRKWGARIRSAYKMSGDTFREIYDRVSYNESLQTRRGSREAQLTPTTIHDIVKVRAVHAEGGCQYYGLTDQGEEVYIPEDSGLVKSSVLNAAEKQPGVWVEARRKTAQTERLLPPEKEPGPTTYQELKTRPKTGVPEPPSTTPEVSNTLADVLEGIQNLKTMIETFEEQATLLRQEATEKIKAMTEEYQVGEKTRELQSLVNSAQALIEAEGTADYVYKQIEESYILLETQFSKVAHEPETPELVEWVATRIGEKLGRLKRIIGGYVPELQTEVQDMIKVRTVVDKIPRGKRLVRFPIPKKERPTTAQNVFSRWWEALTNLFSSFLDSITVFNETSMETAAEVDELLEEIEADFVGA